MLESPVKCVTCSEGGLHQSFPRRAALAFPPSGSCQVLPGTGGFQPYLGKTELKSAAFIEAAAAAKSLQSYPTLCDPIDGSPLGSSVPGILQARILEWVAISFSNA